MLAIILGASIAGGLLILIAWLLLRSRCKRRERERAAAEQASASPWKRRRNGDMRATIRKANELAMKKHGSRRGSEVFQEVHSSELLPETVHAPDDGFGNPHAQRPLPTSSGSLHPPSAGMRGLSRESLAALDVRNRAVLSNHVMTKFTRSLTETLLREDHGSSVTAPEPRSRSASQLYSDDTASYVTEESQTVNHANSRGAQHTKPGTSSPLHYRSSGNQPHHHYHQQQHCHRQQQYAPRSQHNQHRQLGLLPGRSSRPGVLSMDRPMLHTALAATPTTSPPPRQAVATPPPYPQQQQQHQHQHQQHQQRVVHTSSSSSSSNRASKPVSRNLSRSNALQSSFRNDVDVISASLRQSFRTRSRQPSGQASRESIQHPPRSPQPQLPPPLGSRNGTRTSLSTAYTAPHPTIHSHHHYRAHGQHTGRSAGEATSRSDSSSTALLDTSYHSHERLRDENDTRLRGLRRASSSLNYPSDDGLDDDGSEERLLRSRTPLEEPLEADFLPAVVCGLDINDPTFSAPYSNQATSAALRRRQSMEETEA
ncbi:hypothetical protein, variant [Salpingoeca rosetta]|nr:hypothetical protein, variant [Salpingoeca rosetta]EGD72305.1 hypothetical protein, variant [Salpingoeca rosetta]|eukprot:XP_004998875.1 hypothetical protein, variant [Salpingoeca rosetta]